MSEPWETTPNYADAFNRGASGLAGPLDPRLADAYQAGKDWMTPPPQMPFPVLPPVGAPTYGPHYGGGSGTLPLGGGVGRLIEGIGWLPIMLIGLMVGWLVSRYARYKYLSGERFRTPQAGCVAGSIGRCARLQSPVALDATQEVLADRRSWSARSACSGDLPPRRSPPHRARRSCSPSHMASQTVAP